MTKITYLRMFSFAVAFSFASPHLVHADSHKLKIVFSVPYMAESWSAFSTTIAKDVGKRLDVDILLQDGQGSSPTQSSELRNAINQGVDGIVLNPVDVKALVPAVNDVIVAKIPIVTIDRTVIGTTAPVPHVGADNVGGGAAQAKYVIDHSPSGARIIFLTGEPGSSPAIDRAAGVHATLKAAGAKYQIVAEQTGNFLRVQGLTVTQNLLTSLGTPPDVILSSNDDMALGALKALAQAGIPAGKVMVIGFDALPEALAAVRDGQLALTVEQQPAEQVGTSIEEVVSFIRENKPMETKNLMPIVITKDNLKQAERYNELK
jgi:inositol transport system substrate-binding protein